MGAGATVALSAARMYLAGIPGYSVWCVAGGAGVAFAEEIASVIPLSVKQRLDNVRFNGIGGTSAIVIGAIGALAYEMAFDGALSMSDLSLSGGMRAAVGAGAALLGSHGAVLAGMMVLGAN